MGQVRQRIGRNHQCSSLEHVCAKQQVGQGRGQEHQARQAVEKMQHGIEVAQPLAKLQARPQHGVVDAGDLRHAPRPADALADVAGKTFGGQARRLRQLHVSRVVPPAVELERRVRVFRDRFHGNASHLQKGGALDDRTGATEKGRIPQVIAVLHDAVEQLSLVGHDVEGVQVLFKGVRRKEDVRHLHHRQLFVLEKPAHADL